MIAPNLKSSIKKVLILLHDIGFSAEIWLHIVPELSKYFRVIIPYIVGLGYSDKPTVEYTTDFFLESLKGFVDNLSIDKFSIVGASFGGYLASEFAIRYNNRIEKLVLAAPAGMMRSSAHHLDQYIMAALYPTYQNAHKSFREMVYDSSVITEDIIRDFLNRRRLQNAKYAFMSILLGLANSRRNKRRLSEVLSPTLLIWRDNDKVIPLQYAIEYDSEIPNCTLVVISFCGHLPYIEKPLEFSNEVLKFLSD
jgi:2-hydroxy-6-oxonona-2,4-dienedioate hydrolase